MKEQDVTALSDGVLEGVQARKTLDHATQDIQLYLCQRRTANRKPGSVGPSRMSHGEVLAERAVEPNL